LTVNGTLAVDAGILDLNGNDASTVLITGTATVSNTVEPATLTVMPPLGVVDTFAGTLAGGTLSLIKRGAGTLVLTGISSHGGATRIEVGTLANGIDNALPTSTGVFVTGPTATYDINTHSDTVGSVHLWDGQITGTTGVLFSLTDFDMQKGLVTAILGGTTGLVKTPANTVTLAGNNTYTGPTRIEEGTLTVNGVINNNAVPTAGWVYLNAAGVTLNGTGTIKGQVVVRASDEGAHTSVQGITITVPAGGVGLTLIQGTPAARATTFVDIGTTNGISGKCQME
jgi:autotransporter-associated beta strand protein